MVVCFFVCVWRLASCYTQDGDVRLWNLHTGACTAVVDHHTNAVRSVGMLPQVCVCVCVSVWMLFWDAKWVGSSAPAPPSPALLLFVCLLDFGAAAGHHGSVLLGRHVDVLAAVPRLVPPPRSAQVVGDAVR